MRTWRLFLALTCGLLMAAVLVVGLDPKTQAKAKSVQTWFWKAGGFVDYAPNGVPDFDQKQACWGTPCDGINPMTWTYCGPVAAANSLWWFDSKFESPSSTPPPAVNDSYFLITTYTNTQNLGLDDHDPVNVGGMDEHGDPVPQGASSLPGLVDELAWYFDTDGMRTGINRSGTRVDDMFEGLQWWLYGGNPLWGNFHGVPRSGSYYDDYHVQKVKAPDWDWVVEEVERSEDVILLLGFYNVYQPSPGYYEYQRVGGHFVTVAGIDPSITAPAPQIALSDPYFDNAETVIGTGGFVYSGTIYTHSPIPNHPTYKHNDAGNISHDTYSVSIVPWNPINPPPGSWKIVGYNNFPPNFLGQNFPKDGDFPAVPDLPNMHTFVEYAIAVSPFTWKPGGEWVYQYGHDGWTWDWWYYEDDGDSCMPDFMWSGIDAVKDWRAYDGPTALADSLWWFDSKVETLVTGDSEVEPDDGISDHYPLVESPDPSLDDHSTGNTNPLISSLSTYVNTEVSGTSTTDMAAGIQDYLEAKGTDVDFYTKIQGAPSFDWVADEVIACEDVLMLLGFYEEIDTNVWERKSGHWVDVAGVNKESGQVGLSDPWGDGSNIASFFDIVYDGRVFPPEHLGKPFTEEEKLDPQAISHDIYFTTTTSVDPYQWALENYPGITLTKELQAHGLVGLNGGGQLVKDLVDPTITTVVEYAIGVSPYSDLVITKTASVTELTETGPIAYVIEYANTGLASVSDVQIIDTLPTASLSDLATSSMPPLTTNPSLPSTISWNIPKLVYGQSGVITVTAVITEPLVAGIYTNTVTISALASERSPSNNSSQATFQILNRMIYLPIIKK